MLTGRRLLAAVIAAATILFVVGTTIERGERDDHTKTEASAPASGTEAGHSEADEGEAGEGTREGRGEKSEEILGVDPESPALIVAAAVVSLLLAAAVWLWDRRALLWFVAAAMFGFAVLDVREVVHLIKESKAGLVLVAIAVAALHLGASTLAARIGRGAPA